MNSAIGQTPLSPERLPDESARAFRAFCVYCELGPDRSLDRAWKRLTADQGKDCQSARRPGYWAAWSGKYEWVERAEEYDGLIEQERCDIAADQRRQVYAMRTRFAIEEQLRIEKRVRDMDSLLERAEAVPLAPLSLRDLAKYTEARNQTARLGMEGVDICEPE